MNRLLLAIFGLALAAASAAAANAIDLRFRDVDVRDVFRVIARLAGRNVLLGREVKGQITVDLSAVDPMKSLALVAAVNRYEVLERDGVIVIGDPATIAFVRGAGEVEIVPIRFGNAADLAEKLSKLYKGKLEVQADERTNSLLIVRPGK